MYCCPILCNSIINFYTLVNVSACMYIHVCMYTICNYVYVHQPSIFKPFTTHKVLLYVRTYVHSLHIIYYCMYVHSLHIIYYCTYVCSFTAYNIIITLCTYVDSLHIMYCCMCVLIDYTYCIAVCMLITPSLFAQPQRWNRGE